MISVLFISSYAIYVCEMLYICTYTTTFFNRRSRWMRQKWGRLRAFDSKVACRKLLGLRLPCRKVRGKNFIYGTNILMLNKAVKIWLRNRLVRFVLSFPCHLNWKRAKSAHFSNFSVINNEILSIER